MGDHFCGGHAITPFDLAAVVATHYCCNIGDRLHCGNLGRQAHVDSRRVFLGWKNTWI